MTGNKTVLLEVNEVPWVIWDRFVADHPDSALARLLQESSQYTSVTPDAGYQPKGGGHPQLTPWSTWPTVHRGVPNVEHGIWDIGQDLTTINAEHPPVWQLMADAGVLTGVCGSLHSYPVPDDTDGYAFYIPDPFALTAETIPAAAEKFQTFNLSATTRSGRNVSSSVDARAAVDFVASAATLGLRPRTAVQLGSQLVRERFDPAKVTRRRVFQTLIAFDLFMKQLRTHEPTFSTFFCNHVAAAMHRYWAAAYPDDYDELDVTPEWTAKYRGQIEFAVSAIDGMVERLVGFCRDHPEYSLMMTSSMGQAPTKAQLHHTELTLTDPDRFMAHLGAPPGTWRRGTSMFPNFNVVVDEDHREDFARSLDTVKIEGAPLDGRSAVNGFFSLDLGQPNLIDPTVEIHGEMVDPESVGVGNLPIQDLAMKCADHVPEGSLLVFTPGAPPEHDRRDVSTTSIAPNLLAHVGAPVPDYMELEELPVLVG